MARVFLGCVLAAVLTAVVREGMAAWYARGNSAEGIRRAEAWDPGNPEYPARLARVLGEDLESADPSDIVQALENAAHRGPRRAITWANLGEAYELAERNSDANRAYMRAVELFPKSPQINWQLANFLIRTGEAASGVAPLREAILGDPALRAGAFDLAWRAGIPDERVLENVPARQDILSAYLDYLVRTGRLGAAEEVWNRLVASPEPFDLDAAFRYFDALLGAQRVDRLVTVWSDLAQHDPARVRWQPGSANRIQNGSFEEPILNGGFGWRIVPIEGATISLDTTIVQDGTRSLSIQFDGQHNLEFGHVVQYVAIEPQTSYRFVAHVRTEGITTESGPRIRIYDAYDRQALSVETENLAGTAGWQEQELKFRTGPETRLIVIQVARPASHKLDNQIAGTLWLDDLSLTASP